MTAKSPTPLSNAQAEILKTFSVNLNETELQEFKKNIAQFLLKKIRKEADSEWDKKGYSKKTINHWLDEN